MSQAQRSALHVTLANAVPLDLETRPKFFALKNLFWVKLQDFMDIVPRHPHLSGIRLTTRPMVMHEHPFGPDPARDGGTDGGGEGTSRETGLVNGYR